MTHFLRGFFVMFSLKVLQFALTRDLVPHMVTAGLDLGDDPITPEF